MTFQNSQAPQAAFLCSLRAAFSILTSALVLSLCPLWSLFTMLVSKSQTLSPKCIETAGSEQLGRRELQPRPPWARLGSVQRLLPVALPAATQPISTRMSHFLLSFFLPSFLFFLSFFHKLRYHLYTVKHTSIFIKILSI